MAIQRVTTAQTRRGRGGRIMKLSGLIAMIFAAAVAPSMVFGAGTFSRRDFPPDFVFGTSTSAYQVEGAANEDGRKPSIWDTFAHAGYSGGADGDIASDEYHKYKEDVQLMAKMGLDAYRFSISWSRVIPDGKGAVNPKGVQYCNNLIYELISHGIQPHVTLHHYDLPQALEDDYGGWVSQRIIKDFAAYADLCFKEFGDRVKYWTTINEPNVFVLGGYDIGLFPPRRCSPLFGFNCSAGNSSIEPYMATHYILLAHASAARLYREKYQEKQHGFVGINIFSYHFLPLTNTIEDIAASRRAQDFYIGWYLNPLLFGEYPETMKKIAGSRLPSFTKTESNIIKGSVDFIGLNYYNVVYAKNKARKPQMHERDVMEDIAIELTSITNASFEFPITPWGLQGLLEFFKQFYFNLPIYIHENGQRTRRNSSMDDWPRVNYLHAHIGATLDAHRNGSNVRGYFVWSFLDAFELLDGYDSGYGLYYVDLDDPNLKRKPKLSATWYSQFLSKTVREQVRPIELEKNSTQFSQACSS
ncbi:beta-glucosidase 11-like isoform X2 [Prosopis cineraria]|uniref:beta-glucosidase 11-like isoform X2 n=1 Tax=Prosopis cineraria TaxID=364024 RepID=UPI00240F3CA8|nr:beta-glucosidase 11-like isoform X2 [Prosopis cineraria]